MDLVFKPKRGACLFLALSICLTAPCFAEYQLIELDGVIYDDETVASMITIITTTNPIPSIPSTEVLYNAQKSLFQIPAFAKCKKIIVFDGVVPGFEDRIADYESYKQNVIELTKTSPYFQNTELVFCAEWGHLGGAVREALKFAVTPFLFIHQHDFNLVKPFDLNGVIASMIANPNIKHVRLNRESPNDYFKGYDDADEVIEGTCFVPLCRSFGWSDNDHVTRLDYYQNFVMPQCKFGPMEAFLNEAIREAIKTYGAEAHPLYGTYLYGDITDGGYIYHADGRSYKIKDAN